MKVVVGMQVWTVVRRTVGDRTYFCNFILKFNAGCSFSRMCTQHNGSAAKIDQKHVRWREVLLSSVKYSPIYLMSLRLIDYNRLLVTINRFRKHAAPHNAFTEVHARITQRIYNFFVLLTPLSDILFFF